MAAKDFGDNHLKEFENFRDELMQRFLGEMMMLYVKYDELQANETLVVVLDVVSEQDLQEMKDNNPQTTFDFSDN